MGVGVDDHLQANRARTVAAIVCRPSAADLDSSPTRHPGNPAVELSASAVSGSADADFVVAGAGQQPDHGRLSGPGRLFVDHPRRLPDTRRWGLDRGLADSRVGYRRLFDRPHLDSVEPADQGRRVGPRLATVCPTSTPIWWPTVRFPTVSISPCRWIRTKRSPNSPDSPRSTPTHIWTPPGRMGVRGADLRSGSVPSGRLRTVGFETLLDGHPRAATWRRRAAMSAFDVITRDFDISIQRFSCG